MIQRTASKRTVRRFKQKYSDLLRKIVGEYLLEAKGKPIEEIRAIYMKHERRWITICRAKNLPGNRILFLDQTAFETTVESRLPGEIHRLGLSPELRAKYMAVVEPFVNTSPLYKFVQWIRTKPWKKPISTK